MKKSLFFYAAATALMLTACSSEDDILQTGPEKKVAPQEVGFDVYTPAVTNVTRAGLEGTMTTGRLQRSEYEGGGFGVYAFQVQDQVSDAGDGTKASSYLANGASSTTSYRDNPIAPNFMVNEKLLWNATNQGWYYNPLKYWPNETDNDSQNSNATMLGGGTYNHIDRLTFFAYAPYVSEGNNSAPGIMRLTDERGKLNINSNSSIKENVFSSTVYEPSIQYMAALDDPNKAVDLLWGVAPAGGLTYTAVNGKTVNVKEGEPLMDMTKPDVNTSMKFLFQHALARIGVTAVAAIDQVGAGGTLDPNTKITIEKITMKGYFGSTGILNLDNEIANVANWKNINNVDLVANKAKTTVSTLFGSPTTTLTLAADHTTGGDPTNHQKGTIARHLQFVGTPATNQYDPSNAAVAQTQRVGVTTVRQNVIMPALIDNAAGKNRNWYTMKKYNTDELAYSETTPYYTDPDCDNAHLAGVTMPASYTITSAGEYVETTASADKGFKYPQVLDRYKKSAGWYTVNATDVSKKTYDSYQAYTNYVKKDGAPAALDWVYKDDTDGYIQVSAGLVGTYSTYQAYTKLATNVYIPKEGKPQTGDVIVKDGLLFYQLVAANKDYFNGVQLYSYSSPKFTPLKEGTVPTGSEYVAIGETRKVIPYYEQGTYYKRDNNYFMVVPINNVPNICQNLTDEEKLRTVTVQIEYYITTEDSKLAAGRAQTKNVITKDVVFPSIANGKSYNLNLVLGLTSVKMEAEVDDWKVINVQGDLPQNTATE